MDDEHAKDHVIRKLCTLQGIIYVIWSCWMFQLIVAKNSVIFGFSVSLVKIYSVFKFIGHCKCDILVGLVSIKKRWYEKVAWKPEVQSSENWVCYEAMPLCQRPWFDCT